ncbi:Rieske 2Fe-2S domain-containing protein [Streptomyces sp. NPDC002276]
MNRRSLAGLRARAVVDRRFMGSDVALHRTRGGVLRVVHAHCPHREHLVRPFHRFAFDVEGSCVRAPGGTPPRAALLPADRIAPAATWSIELAAVVNAPPAGPWRTQTRVTVMSDAGSRPDATSRPDSPLPRKPAAPSLSAVAGQALMRTVIHHMVQDARIRNGNRNLNRKRCLPDPALTSEEGAIGPYRGRVGQFYPLEAPADRT